MKLDEMNEYWIPISFFIRDVEVKFSQKSTQAKINQSLQGYSTLSMVVSWQLNKRLELDIRPTATLANFRAGSELSSFLNGGNIK